ncbi:hypothetical protein LTR62_001842 [Meristemomyces frigidus]|uniref:Cytochrome b-c1 complex subunit 10 n=1 Tax=Meristemomyces frigidus TaxID=1508187 RepID=A0AAN7YLM9_9PEZI|nr:hypothetical protein LTR62_001842 [Meristemomyces frigidus]
MLPTFIRQAAGGDGGMTQSPLRGGTQPHRFRVNDYQSFKSKFGPDYKIGQHIGGFNIPLVTRLATIGGGMGVAAGIFALFFFDGVPRVQRDILQKIPFIGEFYKHEVPPEDNPF